MWIYTYFEVVITPDSIPSAGMYGVTCLNIASTSDVLLQLFVEFIAAFDCVEPSEQVRLIADSE